MWAGTFPSAQCWLLCPSVSACLHYGDESPKKCGRTGTVASTATHLIYRIGMQAPWDLSAVEQLLAWRDQRNGA